MVAKEKQIEKLKKEIESLKTKLKLKEKELNIIIKNEFYCKTCNISFTSENKLKSHKNSIACLKANNKPVFTCNFCNSDFRTKEQLLEHTKPIDGKIQNGSICSNKRRCNFCKISFNNIMALSRHKKECVAIPKKKVITKKKAKLIIKKKQQPTPTSSVSEVDSESEVESKSEVESNDDNEYINNIEEYKTTFTGDWMYNQIKGLGYNKNGFSLNDEFYIYSLFYWDKLKLKNPNLDKINYEIFLKSIESFFSNLIKNGDYYNLDETTLDIFLRLDEDDNPSLNLFIGDDWIGPINKQMINKFELVDTVEIQERIKDYVIKKN